MRARARRPHAAADGARARGLAAPDGRPATRACAGRTAAHFLGVAAQAMRRVLVDHARRRKRAEARRAAARLRARRGARGLREPRARPPRPRRGARAARAARRASWRASVELRFFGGSTSRRSATCWACSERRSSATGARARRGCAASWTREGRRDAGRLARVRRIVELATTSAPARAPARARARVRRATPSLRARSSRCSAHARARARVPRRAPTPRAPRRSRWRPPELASGTRIGGFRLDAPLGPAAWAPSTRPSRTQPAPPRGAQGRCAPATSPSRRAAPLRARGARSSRACATRRSRRSTRPASHDAGRRRARPGSRWSYVEGARTLTEYAREHELAAARAARALRGASATPSSTATSAA